MSLCLAPLAFLFGGCSQGETRSPAPLHPARVGATRDSAVTGTHGTIAADAVPPVSPPGISVLNAAGERAGVLLAFDWLGAHGRHLVDSPDRGGRVSWIPIDKGSGGVVEFRIQIAVPPVRLDVRTFSGALGPAGVPEGEPVLVPCLPDEGLSSGCSWRVLGGSTTVRWTPSPGVSHVVISGVWHIPASAQIPQGPVDDSASWGFSLASTH